ncbi:MAG: 50S ribosomal protein L11 methyltransferase [Geobacteraceae bacterium]|nr:50S ribosomal protein L11 methyltransferase [Geobacteraceae bacterium]
METRWAEISCTVPEPLTECLADFLLDLTGNGVSIENRKVDTFDVEDIAEEELKTVKCYVPESEDLNGFVAAIEKYFAEFSEYNLSGPEVTILKEEDWANSWKANFKPTRIGRRLVIKPSWEVFEGGAGDVILELDPGMAFGTGTHATTRLCLEALEELVYDKGALAANSTVLDVGCGSGLLGIAAALFGALQVVSIDIDPIAITVTDENAAINGVSEAIAASETPLAELEGEFSIVLANILAEALVQMSSDLVQRVAVGGYLILSGILIEREELVMAGFAGQPLTHFSTRREDEWCCIIFQKSR